MVQLLGERSDKKVSKKQNVNKQAAITTGEQDRPQGRVVAGEASPHLFGTYDEHFRDDEGSYQPLYRVAKLILPGSLYLTWSAFVHFQESDLPPYVTQKQVAEYTKKNLRTIELNMQRLRQAGYLHTRHAMRGGGCVVEKCFDGLYKAVLEYLQWEQSPLYVPPLREYFVVDQLDWSVCQSLLRFNNYRRLICNKKPGPKQKKKKTSGKGCIEGTFKEVPLPPGTEDLVEQKTTRLMVLPINKLDTVVWEKWEKEYCFSENSYYEKRANYYKIEELPIENLPYEAEEPPLVVNQQVVASENQQVTQWDPGLLLFLKQMKIGRSQVHKLELNEHSLVPYTSTPINWSSVFALKGQYRCISEWFGRLYIANPDQIPRRHYLLRRKRIAHLVPSPHLKVQHKQFAEIEKEREELRPLEVKMRRERAWLVKQVKEWEQRKMIYDVHLLELDHIEGMIVKQVKLLDQEMQNVIDEIWSLDFEWLDIVDANVLRARRTEQEFYKKNNYRRYKGPRRPWQKGDKEIALPIYRPLYPPSYYAEIKRIIVESLELEDQEDQKKKEQEENQGKEEHREENQEGKQEQILCEENPQMVVQCREESEEKQQQIEQKEQEGSQEKQASQYQYSPEKQEKLLAASRANYLRNERVQRQKNQQNYQQEAPAQPESPGMPIHERLGNIRDRTAHLVQSPNPIGGPRKPEEKAEALSASQLENNASGQQSLPPAAISKKKKNAEKKNEKRKNAKEEPKHDLRREKRNKPTLEKRQEVPTPSISQEKSSLEIEKQPQIQEAKKQPQIEQPLPTQEAEKQLEIEQLSQIQEAEKLPQVQKVEKQLEIEQPPQVQEVEKPSQIERPLPTQEVEKQPQAQEAERPSQIEKQPQAQEAEKSPQIIDPIPDGSYYDPSAPQTEKQEKEQKVTLDDETVRMLNAAQEQQQHKKPSKLEDGFMAKSIADLKKKVEEQRELAKRKRRPTG